jgi:hypothetical protein
LFGAFHLPLAAATGMDLGLDGADGRAEGGVGGGGFVGGAGDLAGEHGHTGGPEQVFGLIFVDFHGWAFRDGARQYGTNPGPPKAPPLPLASRTALQAVKSGFSVSPGLPSHEVGQASACHCPKKRAAFGLAIPNWNSPYFGRGNSKFHIFSTSWILGAAFGGQRRPSTAAVAEYQPCAGECQV